MKINFNHENKRYTLCTVKEFADILGKMAANEMSSGKLKFIADFALTDIEKDDSIDIDHIEDYIESATGWFGVKELGEVGFNDTDKHFVFDYYGGGQMMMNSFGEDFSETDCSNDILITLHYTLNTEDSWYVLVQWDEDECLKKDEEEAVKPIEDAAVTNFAEMLCDYVSGLDEGEGIGREDIIDHLYEYINWDKRFTREYEEGKKNFKPF